MSLTAYHALITKPAKDAPLVFAFHGTGGDERQFAGLVHDLLPEAGLIAPRGDLSEHGANRYFRRTGEGVYDMADLARRSARMAGFIAAHREANPGAAVYALGYSNGANILAAVSFLQPQLFDRIALLHPLIPWTPDDQPGLAGCEVLITGGRRDPICPLPLTEALSGYYRRQQAKVTLTLQDGGHEIRQDELIALAKLLQRRD
ncbi:MAG: alpha/beta hydrolase [bacterium]